MPLVKKLAAWSYSTYAAYKSCPFKVKLTKIDKLKEPSSPPLAGGSVKHKQVENFIKGLPAPEFEKTTALVLAATGWPGDELYTRHTLKQGVLPPELEAFAEDIKSLKARYKKKTLLTLVEEEWAFTKGWTKTGWFDKDCWLRIKLDCAYEDEPGVLILRDWKSGKYREDQNLEYAEQVQLYAIGAMVQMPHINEVRAQLDYLDTGFTWMGPTYKRSELEGLIKEWVKRVKPMMADAKFAPKPNRYCGFCHFRAKNGGPCKF